MSDEEETEHKCIKRLDPMDGVMNTLSLLMGDTAPNRDDFFRDEVGEILIDTVAPTDTETWETGIKRDGIWIIVQQYIGRAGAKIGHAKWVTKIKEDPTRKLKDIEVWGPLGGNAG